MTTLRLGRFYAVTPGGDEGPEYFEATLDGLTGKHGAMQRAIALSAGDHVQEVTRTDGRTTRVIFAYRDGRKIPGRGSGADLIPASPPPPPAATVTILTGRTRRRDRDPLPDINDPPCNAG